MKNNTLHFVSIFCKSLAIAIVLVVLGATATAKAQNTVPQIPDSVLNGLFTPTSADRFFEEGRRNLEREAEILVNPEHYHRESLLQINTTDIKIIDGGEESTTMPNFPDNNPKRGK